MHVVATAGHVDHGKSTLVRALTGMEPDRHAEEQRRGLTIDLGFAWTHLDEATGDVAFVDVPGHERFVSTMLAGVGPVPVVLFVVAADGGWMPQSGEHLDALDALGVRRGLLVLTRADLAGGDRVEATRTRAREHLAGTTLAGIGEVVVSATTGAGLPQLRAALAGVLARVPAADPDAPVRLWVDRAFSIRGAGTVATGTLGAGRLHVGIELSLPGWSGSAGSTGSAGSERAVVRGLQELGRPVSQATGVARVAVNLRGVDAAALRRGQALTTPGTSVETSEVDVRWRVPGPAAPTARPATLPEQLMLHVGSAAVPVRVRPLGPTHARLTLRAPLPLRIGDAALLRDPGAHRVLAGVIVLDPAPPALRRRGAARERADVLAAMDGRADARGELARRGTARREDLVALGVGAADVSALAADDAVLTDGPWLLDPALAASLRRRLAAEVAAHAAAHPLQPGLPAEAARRRLGLPTLGLLSALAAAAPDAVTLRDGRLLPASAGSGTALPPGVRAAVDAVLADLARSPYAAPEADRLRALGLGARELATAVRAGALARVADGVYLAPATVQEAARPLAALPQPFTLSAARQVWGTSRRVAVPLLELLDRRGQTRRLPDDRRVIPSTRE